MRPRAVSPVPRQGVAAGAAGTMVVHGALIAAVIWSSQGAASIQPVVYNVELVAAPRPAVVKAAPVAAPAPPAPPKVAPKPTPKSAPVKSKPPTKIEPKTEPSPPSKTATMLAPGETPGAGTDVANVRVEGGKQFPDPAYLRNLTNEILRRWARPVGSSALEAEVTFTLMRDGSVRDLRVIRTSRSYSFDLEAQGAIEKAADDLAFGPLPRIWPADILQVAFLFRPRNRP